MRYSEEGISFLYGHTNILSTVCGCKHSIMRDSRAEFTPVESMEERETTELWYNVYYVVIALVLSIALERQFLPKARAGRFAAGTHFQYHEDARPIAYQERHEDIPPVLVIYTTCMLNTNGFRVFDASRLPAPSHELRCSPETNLIDCHEAVPMLDFLINNYEKPLAHKYIFIHGHDRAWHHPTSIFTQLRYLINSSYFQNQEFGGIYNQFYARGCWGPKEAHWAGPLYEYLFRDTSMPQEQNCKENQRPCCATFFMSSSLTQTRPKSEYILIRDRLRQWSREHVAISKGPAYYCGRSLEYTWHILLANKSFIPKNPMEMSLFTATTQKCLLRHRAA